MQNYTVKDSGARTEYPSGMVRDLAGNKIEWHRVADGPMLRRYAEHLTKAQKKYPDTNGQANWLLAKTTAELEHFRHSAFRHFIQWWNGENEEDHAAAVYFNINGAEYVKSRLTSVSEQPQLPEDFHFREFEDKVEYHGAPEQPNPLSKFVEEGLAPKADCGCDSCRILRRWAEGQAF